MSRKDHVGTRARRSRVFTALVSGAAIVALAGCGGDDQPDPAAESQATPSALIGTYTTTLGPSGPELEEPNPPGKWELVVTSSTEAYFQPPEGPSFPVGNPLELSSDRIVFAADPECPTQAGTPGAGVYEWNLDGDTLTFTDVEDTCRDRSFVLTSKTWSKTT